METRRLGESLRLVPAPGVEAEAGTVGVLAKILLLKRSAMLLTFAPLNGEAKSLGETGVMQSSQSFGETKSPSSLMIFFAFGGVTTEGEGDFPSPLESDFPRALMGVVFAGDFPGALVGVGVCAGDFP